MTTYTVHIYTSLPENFNPPNYASEAAILYQVSWPQIP